VADNQDPFLQGRRLRGALRAARQRCGMSQREVSAALEWSTSKLVRLEAGDSSPSTTDLRALLDLYGVTRGEIRDDLIGMARASRRQNWGTYRDLFPREFQLYLSFEGSAARILSFQPLLIPGLLQTESYARALTETFGAVNSSSKDQNRKVAARLQRQSILTRDEPPSCHFILDEAALRRRVGPGGEVMRLQLEKLLLQSEQPFIRIQVVPFEAGEHPGMLGPFVCMEFDNEDDGEIVFLERAYADTVARDIPSVSRLYMERFLQIESISLDVERSRRKIQDLLDLS
jgi:transcriptional regulator with XRE-family HTH domain